MPDPAGALPAQDICPLCGTANDCGLAAGASTCWCFTATIPAATIAQVPEAARDRSCICAACADRTHAAPASTLET